MLFTGVIFATTHFGFGRWINRKSKNPHDAAGSGLMSKVATVSFRGTKY